MKEIANNIYVETGFHGANVGAIITEAGAVLVDTPMIPADAWRWLRRIARLSKEGIAFVISTDYSPIRTLGNCFFPAPSIAHENTWSEIKAHGEAALQRYIEHFKEKDPKTAANLADVRIVLPEITLTDGLAIHKGQRTIEIMFLGGHTPATLGVYVPDSKVLFSSDVVVNERHVNLSQAQSLEWRHSLERLSQMDIETIVPGHGEPCPASAIAPLIEYITEMRRQVQEQYQSGNSRRETVDKVRATMLERFPAPAGAKDALARQVRASIERVYEEIRKGS